MSEQDFAGRRLTRRTFTLLASVSTLALVGSGAAAAGTLLSDLEERAILAVASVVAVVPVPFPRFGEADAAQVRATSSRLVVAATRLSSSRLDAARAGARLLADAVIDVEHDRVVINVANLVRAQGEEPFKAVVALAVAALSENFDPNSDAAAKLWLSFAEQYRRRTSA